jgi:hypothetical protein
VINLHFRGEESANAGERQKYPEHYKTILRNEASQPLYHSASILALFFNKIKHNNSVIIASMKKKKECKIMQTLRKVFGGLEMSWRNTIVFAIIMGVWTALMAMLVPDGNSFHDIAVTFEWWFLPAIFIIVNCKKPLEAALKTFVFFLISQPLVYLIQVPFNSLGWELFKFYPYWFMFTLATFPGGFIAWYMKKDQWYSGIILAVATIVLAFLGVGFVHQCIDNFPNHLLTAFYCFAISPFFIFVIFKDKKPRIIAAILTIIAIIVFSFIPDEGEYIAYNNSFLEENDITLVGEPEISYFGANAKGEVKIIKYDGGYNFELTGVKGHTYEFDVKDKGNNQQYFFKYYYDKDRQTIIIEPR